MTPSLQFKPDALPLIADPADPLQDLIRINSVNPELVPGAPSETAIADFTEAWLAANGYETTRLEATPGRPSIIAVARGTGGGKNLVFNGHLDAVTQTANTYCQ